MTPRPSHPLPWSPLSIPSTSPAGIARRSPVGLAVTLLLCAGAAWPLGASAATAGTDQRDFNFVIARCEHAGRIDSHNRSRNHRRGLKKIPTIDPVTFDCLFFHLVTPVKNQLSHITRLITVLLLSHSIQLITRTLLLIAVFRLNPEIDDGS